MAPGLAAPTPHLFRTPFRHAYAGLRTCRRHESLPSQYALPALTRLVRRSHHRRFISLPGRHCHHPPIRLGWASDGAYRAVHPSDPSASSSCRRMLKFAANKRSAGTNSQTGRQRRTSRILLSTSLIQRTQLSTKTNQNAMSCRILLSAAGKQSTPLAPPAGRVPKKPKKRPMGQPHWMWFQTPPVLTWRRGGRERRHKQVHKGMEYLSFPCS